MYRHAAKLAAQPNSSLKAPSAAFPRCREHNGRCLMPSIDGDIAARKMAAGWANICRRDAMSAACPLGCLPPRIPSSARGHASGLSAAQRQARSSALATPPSGLRFPSTTDPPQMQSFGLGRRGLSHGFA